MATIPAEVAVEKRFRDLATAWHAAVGHHSSTAVRLNHPAYREIVALGPGVVPYLLRDMETKHTHWFAALREITGVNPVPEAAAGNVGAMVDAWTDWARQIDESDRYAARELP